MSQQKARKQSFAGLLNGINQSLEIRVQNIDGAQHVNSPELGSELALKRKLILDRREKSKQDVERKQARSAQLNLFNDQNKHEKLTESDELMPVNDLMDVKIDPIVKLEDKNVVIKIVNINDILHASKNSESVTKMKIKKESSIGLHKNSPEPSTSSQVTPLAKSVKIIRIDPKTLKVLKVSNVTLEPAVNPQTQNSSSGDIKILKSLTQPEKVIDSHQKIEEVEISSDSSSDSDGPQTHKVFNQNFKAKYKRSVETARSSLKSILASKVPTKIIKPKQKPVEKISYNVTVKSSPIQTQNLFANESRANFEEITMKEDENSDNSREFEDESSDEDESSCGSSIDSQNSAKDNQNGLHKCLTCSHSFEYKSELILHQLQHNKKSSETQELSVKLMRAKDSRTERIFVANNFESTSPSQSSPRNIVLSINVHSISNQASSQIKLNCVRYENYYKCKECDFEDNSIHNMTQHALDHRSGVLKELTCEICKHVSKNRTELDKHSMTHTKLYTCPMSCNYTTDYKTELDRHVKFHKNGADKATSRRPKCYHCNVNYPNQDALLDHIREVHNLTLEEFNVKKSEHGVFHPPPVQQKVEDFFKCKECNFSTASMTKMREHANQHKTIKCPHCSFTTDYESVMRRHSEIHKDEKSPQFYVTKKRGIDLAQHIRNGHANDRVKNKYNLPFKCVECAAKFHTREMFHRHIVDNHRRVKIIQTEKSQIYEAKIYDEIVREKEFVIEDI